MTKGVGAPPGHSPDLPTLVLAAHSKVTAFVTSYISLQSSPRQGVQDTEGWTHVDVSSAWTAAPFPLATAVFVQVHTPSLAEKHTHIWTLARGRP